MDSSIAPNGMTYHNHIQAFSEAAFDRSHYYGKRRSIGKLSFGVITAAWHSPEHRHSILTKRGIARKDSILSTSFPLSLHTTEEIEGAVVLSRKFQIDFALGGLINAYSSIIRIGSIKDIAKSELYRQIHPLERITAQHPSDEELEILYDELAYGASGEYAYKALNVLDN